MQAIADENAVSATAFLVREGSGYGLRWFTPRVEEEMCGHGTLGAAWVVLERLEQRHHGLRVGLKATKFAVRGHVQRNGEFVNVFEATIIGVSLGKWEDLLRA